MNEAEVKAATLTRVRQAAGHGRKPIVTAEFSLGDSGVRADLAIFGDELIGIEIKTEKDTLRRLSSQMAAYCRYFHHAIAIVAPSHVRNLTEGHLQGASLWTYDASGFLFELHCGRVNSVNTETLENVLTQTERRKLDFMGAMSARYGPTSKLFWRSVARRAIRSDDLPLLSRFADGRVQARRLAAEREAKWDHWLAAQGC